MKIGVIGAGNMGTAIIKGHLAANPGQESELSVFDVDGDRCRVLEEELGIRTAQSPEAAADADLLLLAVKPGIFDTLLPVLSGNVPERTVFISIAAGISISYIESFFKAPVKVVRVMPNTPALVGMGMSALCRNGQVADAEFEAVVQLFSALGRTEVISESLIDSVVGVSGSSPAYVYMFIEALADGAVEQGMPRKQAYAFAAQAVMGSAKMVLETGLHPGELKDMVCSPGGTTIEAVRILEKKGMRSAVMEAVRKASEKSREMNKK